MLTQVIHQSWGIGSLWIRDADLSSTDTYRLRGRSISIREEFLTPLFFCISLQRTGKKKIAALVRTASFRPASCSGTTDSKSNGWLRSNRKEKNGIIEQTKMMIQNAQVK
jgi:hypothetical protein